MNDPAMSIDDYRQDAQVAICEGRLTQKGIPAAIANRKRSRHRHMACRRKHEEAVWLRLQHGRVHPHPAELLDKSEQTMEVARSIFKHDPKLLAILLMRALELPLSFVAEVTGLSEGTISRAPRRAESVLRSEGARAKREDQHAVDTPA